MAVLEIQNLNKSYGQNLVLRDINLTVPEGEFFVVLGPSGGGKSTLLRVLCGIEPADTGVISLAGREITHLPPRERNIGMVFQDYGLYPHMNAWDNIAYGLEARKMPKNMIEERIKTAAEKLGITPLLQRVIVDLSGGEQQRVALARALAKDADLYLFDEPLSNLDPKLRVQARRDILMVHREKHKPTLYVTHDQTEALASGDRIGIIARGQLQQVGTADDLIQHPANTFVASFIGSPSMNLVTATLAFDSDRNAYTVQFAGQVPVRLPAHWNDRLSAYNKTAVVLGIPATAFLLGNTEASANAGGYVQGEVENEEGLIGEIIVMFKIEEGTSLAAIFQSMDDLEFPIGSSIRLGIDSEQLSLFDFQTETAL
ncbi:MAG: ABC transporter ATP-binding protein [Anaerolineaceae bacterium]|nr:ABC transporter ATP-binding protein [Anaerolineaceae bacterium]